MQVLSLENPDWLCKIDEGSAGLLNAVWAPNSRSFLTTTEFYLRITVWSLSEVSVSYLKYPKACPNNLAFSPGGRYLALVERRNFQDHLSLFDCHADWSLVRNIKLETQDAVGIIWSPDGRYLVVWDDCLRYCAAIYTLDGRHLHTYRAYKPGQELLGIKSVVWSPSGQLLAIGSYDQKCRILNHINWTCLACLSHPVDKPIDPSLGLSPTGRALSIDHDVDTDANGYRPHRIDAYEEYRSKSSELGSTNSKQSCVQYKLINEPFIIPSIKPDVNTPFPKIGIGLMAFSSDGRFLATRNDNAPSTVWIWSIDRRLSLFSLLTHTSGPVSSLMWDPTSSARLALCTSSDCVFIWTPQGSLAIQTPSHFDFAVDSLCWLSTGDTLLLLSDAEFCMCYLDSDSQDYQDKHKPLWQPPRFMSSGDDNRQFPPLNYNSESEDDEPTLPVGVFGKHEDTNDLSSGAIDYDGPKWLQQHIEQKSSVDQNIRRRSLSSCNERKSESKHIRPVSIASSTRQAWDAPRQNSKPIHKTVCQDRKATKKSRPKPS